MTPDYRIHADDTDVTAALRDRLIELRVHDEPGIESDTVEVRLDDRAGLRGGRIALPRRGADLSVALGYDEAGDSEELTPDARALVKTGLVTMGLFTVDEVELSGPPDTLTVRAKAADVRDALKQRKTRSWSGKTLGEIIRAVAAEHGLRPAVAEELAGLVTPHLDQTEESDLNLLSRLAERYDAVAKPAARRLLFTPRGAGRSATDKPLERIEVSRAQTAAYRVTLADRDRYGSARAVWRNAAGGVLETVAAGTGEPTAVLREVYASEAEAAAAAQSLLDAFERSVDVLSLTINPGNPALASQTPLSLRDFRPGIDGRWTALRVTHLLDHSGYTTEVAAEEVAAEAAV